MISSSIYHMVLRTSALTLALLLLFVSGLLSPITRSVSQNTTIYLANTIGMYAAVLPNETNTLNTQLEQKKKAIEAREIAVTLRERENAQFDFGNLILSGLVFLLLVLMVINYVLDFARARAQKSALTIQDEKMA